MLPHPLGRQALRSLLRHAALASRFIPEWPEAARTAGSPGGHTFTDSHHHHLHPCFTQLFPSLRSISAPEIRLRLDLIHFRYSLEHRAKYAFFTNERALNPSW